jgi:tetratricopeptide (TPR) repeat protein/predicted Ser/Thr protein kinase
VEPPTPPSDPGDLFGAFAGEAQALEGQLVASTVREKLFGRAKAVVRVGRFAILEELGRGGMGVVHAAFDRALDRKVAIKSILFSRASSDASRKRMVEEARAMAKLSHANVVHVYEVGEHDERVYIAMEFVEGPTLATWLETPRSADTIVDVFTAAAEGLSAAHRAGVIHRDFKPDNVLLNARDVPKVADFGLAGVESTETPQSWSAAGITKTGDCIGTPRYMSPEQHRGSAATPASDQFSFCVALFEALSGSHPFLTDSLDDFIPAMEANRIVAETERPLPRRVRRVLARGLRHEPTERHPNMAALLEALRASRRSPRAWLGLGAIAVFAGTAALASDDPAKEPCADVGESIRASWPTEASDSIQAQFGGDGHDDVAAQMVGRVDRFADAWAAARKDACVATSRGEQSERRLDLRMQCLDAQQVELEATLSVVESLPATERLRALDALSGLPAVDGCADGAALELRAPGDAPVEHLETSQRLRRQLATVKARLRAGQLDTARADADALIAEAERIGDLRVRAEALSWLGWREAQSEVYDTSEPRMRAAFFTAAAAGLDEVAIGIAVDLANLEANDGTATKAARWHDHAAAALARGRFEGTDLDAYLEHSRGILDDVSAKHEDAAAHFRRALEILDGLSSAPQRSDTSSVKRSLGMALTRQRKFDEARVELEGALALRQANFGDRHPLTVRALSALGALEYEVGNHAAAVTQLERAKALAIEVLGPRDVEIANLDNNLSGPLLELKRTDDAVVVLDEAASIYAELEGHEDDLGIISFNLANTIRALGRPAEAQKRYEAAATALTTVNGETDRVVLLARYGAATCMIMQNDVEPGLKALEAAVDALVTHYPDPFFQAGSWLERAHLLASVGQTKQARESAEAGLRYAREHSEAAEIIPQLEAWLKEQGKEPSTTG